MKELKSNQYPKTHLANPAFVYKCAVKTDLRETFERIKKTLPKRKRK